MKIPAKVPPKEQKGVAAIPTGIIPEAGPISFSFKNYFCKSTKTKEFNNKFFCKEEFIIHCMYFIQKLSEFSKMTFAEIRQAGKSTRCHPVTGEQLALLKETLMEMGMPQSYLEQIVEFYQLTITTANGRLFGYFIENIFYILLWDPHHLMYKDLKYYSKNDIIVKSYDPWTEII